MTPPVPSARESMIDDAIDLMRGSKSVDAVRAVMTGLCEAYAATKITELEATITKLKKEHQEEIREMMRDAREFAAEARWEARQGEDYGSY